MMFSYETQQQITLNYSAAATGGSISLTAAAYREILQSAEQWQAHISGGNNVYAQYPLIPTVSARVVSTSDSKWMIVKSLDDPLWYYQDSLGGRYNFTQNVMNAAKYGDTVSAQRKRLELLDSLQFHGEQLSLKEFRHYEIVAPSELTFLDMQKTK